MFTTPWPLGMFSLITIAKFSHADQSSRNYKQVESISDLHLLQDQLEKAQCLAKSVPSLKVAQ